VVRGRPGVSGMTEPFIWFLGQLARTGRRDIKQPTAGRKGEREDRRKWIGEETGGEEKEGNGEERKKWGKSILGECKGAKSLISVVS